MYLFIFNRSRAIDFVNAFPPRISNVESIVGWGLERLLSQVLHEAVIDSLQDAWLLRLARTRRHIGILCTLVIFLLSC